MYRVDATGDARRIYAAKATHVRPSQCRRRRGVAGTDTPGQVLKLDGLGKAFVWLDTPYREIRSLRFAPDGRLLVAAMSGRAASDSRLPSAARG